MQARAERIASMQPTVQVASAGKILGAGQRRVTAVDDVSFELGGGEILALLGPNGAGKSTLVKMIAGLVTPTRGTIRVQGADVSRRRAEAVRHLGAVLEGSRNVYWKLTVQENVEYAAALRRSFGGEVRARIGEVLETLQLTGKARCLAQELSRGMQQRVALACALVCRPRVLLLDEPTLGLDYESDMAIRRVIRALARSEGTSVLLTTHQMDLAQNVAHRVGIMRQGRLLAMDSVERLCGLASERKHTVRVVGALAAEAVASLRALGLRVDATPANTAIRVGAHDPRELYRVIDIVRPARLAGVDDAALDLEQVYLEVVGGEGTVR